MQGQRGVGDVGGMEGGAGIKEGEEGRAVGTHAVTKAPGMGRWLRTGLGSHYTNEPKCPGVPESREVDKTKK